jgi:hypothetical protein
MQFKTPQAQAAYAEVIAETGRIVQQLRADLQALGERVPTEALSLAVTAISRGADLQLAGLAKAIELGTEVDVRWSSLAGHLAMAASGDA